MLKHNLLWGALFVNVFAGVHVLQQNISSANETVAFNSSFANKIVSALAECSVPIYSPIENHKPTTNFNSERSDHTYSDRQDEPILASYKRSSFYDNYDSNDSDSNRRDNQTSSNSRSNNSNNDEYNSDGSWSDSRSNARGHHTSNSRSNERNNHAGNNSRDNHNNDDQDGYSDSSRDNRHNYDEENSGDSSRHFGYNSGRNSRNDRHGSRDNSSDDNDQDDDDSTNNNQKDNKHGRSSNDSSKNSNRSVGMQHILRRKSRETYNTGTDGVSACTVQCILSRIQVVNEDGFPSEAALVSFLEKSLSDLELLNSSKLIIRDCFGKLHSEMEEDNCKFSKKLADCLGLEFKKSSFNGTV